MKAPQTKEGREFLFGEWVMHDLHCDNGADKCDCGPGELIAAIEDAARTSDTTSDGN